MNLKDIQKGAIGYVTLQRWDGDKLLEEVKGPNTVMNGARGAMASLIFNNAGLTSAKYLALGTGSSNPTDPTQTALGSEITDTGLARSVATITFITTTLANDTASLTFTWTATGVKVISEIGIFNAASGPTMFARKVLPSTITTANGNTIVAIYTYQLT